MLKRIISVLITLGVIFGMVTISPARNISANEGNFNIQNVSTDVHDSNREINISGNTSADGESEVTITIKNPNGEIDYLNQETSDQNGNFAFTYVPSVTWNGNYEIRIGGEGVENPHEVLLLIGDEGDGEGNGDGTNGGSGTGGDNSTNGGTDDKGDTTDKNDQGGQSGDVEKDSQGGKELPTTATNLYNYLTVGIILLIAGSGIVLIAKRRKINI